MSEKEIKKNELNIEINDDVASGIYSNLAIITHSNSEFIIDFIRIMPNIPKAKVKSRIILTPQHAKRLLKALSENISKYESLYGDIKDAGAHNKIPLNFGGPTAQA
jgi:hypothetical protein